MTDAQLGIKILLATRTLKTMLGDDAADRSHTRSLTRFVFTNRRDNARPCNLQERNLNPLRTFIKPFSTWKEPEQDLSFRLPKICEGRIFRSFQSTD